MDNLDIALLSGLIFVAAALYSSVGHAGASAYLAAMGLLSVPIAIMRPTALALNILVAGIGSYRYIRAGQFAWNAYWPFVIGSVPGAFIGGTVHLPPEIYKPLVAIVLLSAALRLLWPRPIAPTLRRSPAWPIAVLLGAAIGLLAGVTGVGGGVYLSPLLLFFGWAEMRKTLGITAAFILVNSIAGLAGNYASVGNLPAELPWFLVSALAGALIGTTAGLGQFSTVWLLRALGLVLIVSSAKLLFI